MSKFIELGRQQLKGGNFAEAFDVFSSALRQSNYSSYPAAYGAGRAAGSLRHFDQAIEMFTVAAKIAGEKAEPYVELAALSYWTRRFDDALRYLDRAETIAPLSEAATMMRVRCHFELRHYDAVLRMSNENLELHSSSYRKSYEWSVRKARALFHIGALDQASQVVQELRDADEETVSKSSDLDHDSIEPIDVVLNCYRRGPEVQFQRWWIEQQTIPVRKFWVWQNNGGSGYTQQRIRDSHNALNDENHKFYGRFTYGLLSDAKYLAYFDDDTIPGLYWLENCLANFQRQPGVYVAVGVRLKEPGKYAPHDRCGWVAGDQQECVDADLGGHAWFFERDWLRYFWFEKPATFETGEDMHLSFCVQRHLLLPTIAPPHPKECMGMWGSVLGYELGQNIGSSSFSKAGSHFEQRDFCVQNLSDRGWRLLNE